MMIGGMFISPLFQIYMTYKVKGVSQMNRKIIIAKWVVIIVYALAVIALYFNFENVGYSVFEVVAYFALLILLFSAWMVVVFLCATSHFAKLMITWKMMQAEKQLGNISDTQIESYRRKIKGDYITMKFRSKGIPIEDWEKKRNCIQSAINYTIISDFSYYKGNWDIITFDARKGRVYTDAGRLFEDGI